MPEAKPAHPDNLDDEELQRLMTSGSRTEVDRAAKMLVAKKLSIENQLRTNRTDAVQYRKELVDAGYHPAAAKWEAEAFSRSDWRDRAVSALRRTDSQLSRLKARITALSGAPKMLAAEVLKVSTAEEAAERIRAMVASGEIDYFNAAVPFADGLLLIYRKGDPR